MLVQSVGLSVFFYLFLIFFLPFGVSNYDPQHEYTTEFLLEIFSFFVVTLVLSLVNEFALKRLIVKEISTNAIVLWSIWTLILLGLSNFLAYNILGNWHDFTLTSALSFVVNCSAVFIFPMLGIFFYFRYRSLQSHVEYFKEPAGNVIEGERLITFEGEGTKDKIALNSSSFIYGRAQDNYVSIHYVERDVFKKQLLRASLGKLCESIDHPAIARTHRSYMVNLLQVSAVKGGKKDITLFMGPESVKVPVSRTYREDVSAKLREIRDMT